MIRALAAISALLALAACGQSTTTVGGPVAVVDTSQAAAGAQTPAGQFLDKAAQYEAFEIQAAEIAQQRAQAQAVKDYSAAQAQEHSAAAQAITELAQTNNLPAPNAALSEDHNAYLNMLRQAAAAQFDSTYLSQQALVAMNAGGTYDAFIATADDGPVKQWAQTQAPKFNQAATTARAVATPH